MDLLPAPRAITTLPRVRTNEGTPAPIGTDVYEMPGCMSVVRVLLPLVMVRFAGDLMTAAAQTESAVHAGGSAARHEERRTGVVRQADRIVRADDVLRRRPVPVGDALGAAEVSAAARFPTDAMKGATDDAPAL